MDAFVCVSCRKTKVRLPSLESSFFAPPFAFTSPPSPILYLTTPHHFPSSLLPPPPQRLCDRHFPCGRCFRLGQQCRPPPGFLDDVAAAAAAAAATIAPPSSSSVFFKNEGQQLQQHQKELQTRVGGGGEEGDQQQKHLALAPMTLRLMDLSIRTGKPAEWAAEFISVFQERFEQGEICRARTVKML